jgi:tRNA dimethylallyltransferase
MHKPQVIIIGGPTGSGKSKLALELSEFLPIDIINGDSLQVYKELPILTSQPSPEDQKKVPHHLFGYRSAEMPCTAAAWIEDICPILDEIIQKGRIPLIVGGTGMYLKAITEGLTPTPSINSTVREEVRRLALTMSPDSFYQHVISIDPQTHKLEPNDKQRLTRALEVKLETGSSIYDLHRKAKPPRSYSYYKVYLEPPRQLLYERINMRFDNFIEMGAIDEVKQELSNTGHTQTTLHKAIGFPELAQHINGEFDLCMAMNLAKQHSRNYAKRQLTWFRHQYNADLMLSMPSAEEFIQAWKLLAD